MADTGGVLDESDETDNATGWVQIVVEDQRVDYSMDAVTVLPTSDLNLNVDPYNPSEPAGWLDLTLTAANDSNIGTTGLRNHGVAFDRRGSFAGRFHAAARSPIGRAFDPDDRLWRAR